MKVSSVLAAPKKFEHKTYIQEQKSLLHRVKTVNADNATRVDGWQNVLTGLGICGRDKKMNSHFSITKLLNEQELDQMYRTDGLTRRIIDLFANEMIRQGWEIEGDQEGKCLCKLDDLKASMHLTNLIKWARLYGGAVCVMGINDGLPLDMPVDENSIRDVEWLRVFDRYEASSSQLPFEYDLNSPNYGFPDIYTISDNRTGAIFFVHHSRILRMDWSMLPPRWQNHNNGWGDPLMQSIYEEIRNYSTVFSSTATMMQDFVNAILSVPNLSEVMASQCGEQNLMKRLNIFNLSKSMMNLGIIDAEEKYEKITTNVSGISEILDRFMVSLSAVCGIPVTLLFGRSAAGMNATGDNDVRNFYDSVKQEQEVKLKPILEKLIRYIMLSKDGAFLGVEPEDWAIQFVPLWQNTEEQEAIIRKIVAETDALYIDRGVLDPSEVAISRFGGNHWSMNTEIDIEARENGFNSSEVEVLEKEVKEKEKPAVGIGPDFIGTGINGYTRVSV
jgi:hypothetical protein